MYFLLYLKTTGEGEEDGEEEFYSTEEYSYEQEVRTRMTN